MHIVGIRVAIDEDGNVLCRKNWRRIVLQFNQSFVLLSYDLISKRQSIQMPFNARGLSWKSDNYASIKFVYPKPYYRYSWYDGCGSECLDLGKFIWPIASSTILPSYVYHVHKDIEFSSSILVYRVPQIFIFLNSLFNKKPDFESIANVYHIWLKLHTEFCGYILSRKYGYRTSKRYGDAIYPSMLMNPNTFVDKEINVISEVHHPSECLDIIYETHNSYGDEIRNLDLAIQEELYKFRLYIYTDYGSIKSFLWGTRTRYVESENTIVIVTMLEKDLIKTMTKEAVPVEFLYAFQNLPSVVFVKHIDKLIGSLSLDPEQELERDWFIKMAIEQEHKNESKVLNITPVFFTYDKYEKRFVKYFAVILNLKPVENLHYSNEVKTVLYFFGDIEETHRHWSSILLDHLKEILFNNVIGTNLLAFSTLTIPYIYSCLFEIDKMGTAHPVLAFVPNFDLE